MAALNEPQAGNMKGISGIDYACYRQARRAGLLGTFKAFLSSKWVVIVLSTHYISIKTKIVFFRVQNLETIVQASDRNLPVVNTRGDILFHSWKSIFNGNGGLFTQTPRIYSFNGKNVLTDPLWWVLLWSFVIDSITGDDIWFMLERSDYYRWKFVAGYSI